ncbi:MAG: hypothetical protein JSW71_22325 [Gemmatimonadota bacterium]|nr:MAG: hypothetical protein JSW71_22325 [Gemmatimonadota bacterium]
MTARTLGRYCGLLTLAVGILLLALGILPVLILPAREPVVNWVLDNDWAALSTAAFVLATLLPLVMTGIYAFQLEHTGVTGLIGLALTVLGMLLLLGFQFDMAFVWPVLASEMPRLLDFDGAMFDAPRFSFIHFWMGPLFTLGMLVFGISTIRARVFPRWSGISLTIGMILSAGILFPPLLLRTGGALLATAALMRIGLVMLEGRPLKPARSED